MDERVDKGLFEAVYWRCGAARRGRKRGPCENRNVPSPARRRPAETGPKATARLTSSHCTFSISNTMCLHLLHV